MKITVYESDNTPHEIETRNEWGRECREIVEGADHWYHDMGDGRYVRDDEGLTLYASEDFCK